MLKPYILKTPHRTNPSGSRVSPLRSAPFTAKITTYYKTISTEMCTCVCFFFGPTAWPRGCHPHCTSCPEWTVLSECSTADIVFLDASPSAVGRNRPQSPPPGYPTSRSPGSSPGCVDQGVARVPSLRMPRPAPHGGACRSFVYSPFKYPKGCLCHCKGC